MHASWVKGFNSAVQWTYCVYTTSLMICMSELYACTHTHQIRTCVPHPFTQKQAFTQWPYVTVIAHTDWENRTVHTTAPALNTVHYIHKKHVLREQGLDYMSHIAAIANIQPMIWKHAVVYDGTEMRQALRKEFSMLVSTSSCLLISLICDSCWSSRILRRELLSLTLSIKSFRRMTCPSTAFSKELAIDLWLPRVYGLNASSSPDFWMPLEVCDLRYLPTKS